MENIEAEKKQLCILNYFIRVELISDFCQRQSVSHL